MALPPKGDPQRPLHLAVRMSRIFGVLFVALGMLSILPYVLRTRGQGISRMRFVLAEGMVLFLLPGALYVICSVFLLRRQCWAAIVALILDVLHLGLVLYALGATVIYAPWIEEPILLILLSIIGIFAVALAALGYYLVKSFRAIRERPPELDRGFEPLPAAVIVRPVIPSGEADHGAANR